MCLYPYFHSVKGLRGRREGGREGLGLYYHTLDGGMGGVIKAERLRPARNPALSKMDRWTEALRGVEPGGKEICFSSKYVSRLPFRWLHEFGKQSVRVGLPDFTVCSSS